MAPSGAPKKTVYLVPDIGAILHVQYEGANTQREQGWLFGTLILETPTLPPRRRGWIPAWAVRRLRPPGPIRRRAWDGCVYTLLQWQEYYGDALGTLYWEQAPAP